MNQIFVLKLGTFLKCNIVLTARNCHLVITTKLTLMRGEKKSNSELYHRRFCGEADISSSLTFVNGLENKSTQEK